MNCDRRNHNASRQDRLTVRIRELKQEILYEKSEKRPSAGVGMRPSWRYNIYMLLTNTNILRAWYCLCLIAAMALAAISFYNADRWQNQNGGNHGI